MSQKSNDKYRLNVGIIILNKAGDRVWLGKINRWYHWQFPQGGVDANESIKQAMYRELYEETGLTTEQITLVAESKKWYFYKFPRNVGNIVRDGISYIGQKQKWFLVQLKDDNVEFKLDIDNEFEEYRWVSYWYPIRNIVYFKEDVYRKVLKEFSKFVFNKK